jgi:hypothetical protein
MLELRSPKYVIVQGHEEGEESTKESGVLKVMMEKFAMPETLKVRLHAFSSHLEVRKS